MKKLRNQIIGLMAAALFIVFVSVIAALVVGFLKDRGIVKFEETESVSSDIGGSKDDPENPESYVEEPGMDEVQPLSSVLSEKDLSALRRALESIGVVTDAKNVDMVEKVLIAEGASDIDFQAGVFGASAQNIHGEDGARNAYIAVYLDQGKQRETLVLSSGGQDGWDLEVSVRDASALDEVLYSEIQVPPGTVLDGN